MLATLEGKQLRASSWASYHVKLQQCRLATAVICASRFVGSETGVEKGEKENSSGVCTLPGSFLCPVQEAAGTRLKQAFQQENGASAGQIGLKKHGEGQLV